MFTFYSGNLNQEVADFIKEKMTIQERKEQNRKFPPYATVKFKGTLQDLAQYVNNLDEAKAVLFDGGIGTVMGSDEFPEGTFYFIDFGDVGYHNFVIPENLLEKI